MPVVHTHAWFRVEMVTVDDAALLADVLAAGKLGERFRLPLWPDFGAKFLEMSIRPALGV